MNRSSVFLIAVAGLLAGAYVYFFSDWFHTPRIQIIPAVRPARGGVANQQVYPISFTLDGKYNLTGVKVVEAEAYRTNKYALPMWDLVPATNVVSSQGFVYGSASPGMKPSQPRSGAQPLKPNVVYRLLLQAGRARGEVDFKSPAVPDSDN